MMLVSANKKDLKKGDFFVFSTEALDNDRIKSELNTLSGGWKKNFLSMYKVIKVLENGIYFVKKGTNSKKYENQAYLQYNFIRNIDILKVKQ